ncbi:hypothetical protein [Dysgonomonas capnocytophagoides]|uniref:hypothetical protein n=1 Tax=Dysgonomonas capnocytophagoides TaxID=45254 RepID=UPI0030C7C640
MDQFLSMPAKRIQVMFGAYIQCYRLVSRPVGHLEHYAADQLYIDFAGDCLEVVDE